MTPIRWPRRVDSETEVLADPERCTYRTGHGICGELDSAGDIATDYPVHGFRAEGRLGGRHRFRHDPTDQLP